MLLARPEQQDSQGRATLLARAAAFQRGEWRQLLAAARPGPRAREPPTELDPAEASERKRQRACAKVRQGELSRARQVPTAAELAPGTEATWDALTDAAKRPPEKRVATPAELLQCQPERSVQLSTRAVASALREARRGGAAGLSGMRAEHLKLLLQDLEALELLAEAATHLAQAHSPPATAGGTPRGRAGPCRKAKAASRAIPLLRRCSRWGNTRRSAALLAFLDDLYVVTVPELSRACAGGPGQHDDNSRDPLGVASNLGKTRAFTLGETPPPPGISELGAAVWRGDKPPPERGLVVRGTPIGHPEFVRAWAAERMQEERKLLEQLPELPDLQCSWLLLSMCASTRANHALRTLPPSESRGYAAAHDAAIWETLQACLGGEPLDDAPHAWPIATLPAVLGGLGNAQPRPRTGLRGQTRCRSCELVRPIWQAGAGRPWKGERAETPRVCARR